MYVLCAACSGPEGVRLYLGTLDENGLPAGFKFKFKDRPREDLPTFQPELYPHHPAPAARSNVSACSSEAEMHPSDQHDPAHQRPYRAKSPYDDLRSLRSHNSKSSVNPVPSLKLPSRPGSTIPGDMPLPTIRRAVGIDQGTPMVKPSHGHILPGTLRLWVDCAGLQSRRAMRTHAAA